MEMPVNQFEAANQKLKYSNKERTSESWPKVQVIAMG